MKDTAVRENVLRYMVENSKNGVVEGTPRDTMEDLNVSSGPLYHQLYDLGLRRNDRGRNAKWTIPESIIRWYN